MRLGMAWCSIWIRACPTCCKNELASRLGFAILCRVLDESIGLLLLAFLPCVVLSTHYR